MESPQGLFNLLAGLAVMLGLVYCFAGFRIRRFILAVPGYIAGAVVLGAIAYLLSQQMWVAVLAGIFAGGPIGASIVLALYNVKVFAIGLLLGAVIDVALYLITDGQIEPAVLLIIPIVTGVLALVYDKWIIVAGTAFGGAGLAVGGIAYFAFGGVGPAALFALMEGDPSLLAATLVGWLVLGLSGVIVQYQSLKPRDDGDWWGGSGGDTEQGSSRSVRPESRDQGRSSGQSQLSASPRIRRQALTGHSEVSAIIWDPHGRWFATDGKHGEVYLWDPQTGRPMLQLWGGRDCSRDKTSLAVAQDGSWIAAKSGGNRSWFWDTATGRLLATPDTEPSDDLCPLAIDSSGELWNRTTWVEISCREYWASSGNAADPNRRWVASRENKGRIAIRDMRNGRRLKELTSGRDVMFHELIASGDGRWLVSREAFHLDFWLVDGPRSAPSPRFEGTSAVKYQYAGTRVGQRRFAVASARKDREGTSLELWGLSDYPELLWQKKFPSREYPRPITAAPNGHWIACLSGSIEIFDTASGQLMRSFPGNSDNGYPTAGSASPDGRALAGAFEDGSVALFDVETGNTRHRHLMPAHQRRLKVLEMAADGNWLAAGGDSGAVHLWEPATGRLIKSIAGWSGARNVGGVVAMAAPREGSWLATVHRGTGQIAVLDMPSGHQRQTIEFTRMHNAGREVRLACTQDCQHLVVAHDDNRYLHLFNYLSGKRESTDSIFDAGGISRDFYCWLHAAIHRPLASGFLYEDLCIWRSFHQRMTGPLYDSFLQSWIRPLGRILSIPFHILREMRLLPAKAPLSGIAPSRDATWLAAPGGSEGILVRNRHTGKELHRLHGHEGSVNSLAVHPNGRWLFSAGDDGIIRRWDMSRLPAKPVCDLAMEALPDDDWVVWKVNPDDPEDRYWTDYSPGAKRWLGWHAPVAGTDRWAHQPMDAFPDVR